MTGSGIQEQYRGRGRMIRWEDGVPVSLYAPPLKKSQVSDLITAAMSTEYSGDRDESGKVLSFDVRFAGMTCIEVAAVRLAEKAASGDSRALTELLDRTLGKPKQSVESVGVKMTYQDFLAACEDNDGGSTDATVFTPEGSINVSVVSEAPNPMGLFDDDDDNDDDLFG